MGISFPMWQFSDIYNALTIHGLAKCPTLPRSVLDVEKFWRSTGYIISGDEYSLDDIEHGVLRGIIQYITFEHIG